MDTDSPGPLQVETDSGSGNQARGLEISVTPGRQDRELPLGVHRIYALIAAPRKVSLGSRGVGTAQLQGADSPSPFFVVAFGLLTGAGTVSR